MGKCGFDWKHPILMGGDSGGPFASRASWVLDLKQVGSTLHLLTAEQASTGEMQLLVRAWNGTTWNALGSALTGSGLSVLSAKMADQSSTPWVIFNEGALGDTTGTVRVRRYASGNWVSVTAPAPASAPKTSEVAIAASGQNVWVALTGTMGSQRVAEEFFSVSQGAFSQRGGTLYAAFQENDSNNYTDALIRTYSGSAWQTKGNPVSYTGKSLVQRTAPL